MRDRDFRASTRIDLATEFYLISKVSHQNKTRKQDKILCLIPSDIINISNCDCNVNYIFSDDTLIRKHG